MYIGIALFNANSRHSRIQKLSYRKSLKPASHLNQGPSHRKPAPIFEKLIAGPPFRVILMGSLFVPIAPFF
jgi:hypothetical protein